MRFDAFVSRVRHNKRLLQRRRSFHAERLESREMLAADPIVTVNTNYGSFQIELLPEAAPQTVANFLSYVDSGAYTNSIFHRSVPGFVEQSGGFTSASPTFSSTSQFTTIPTNAPIPLEYNLPNVVGSVAMARTYVPNSATDQWFVNLIDNSSTLGPGGSSTDGYAVFGKILGNGMDVLNKIASLDVHNEGSGVFSQLPLGQSNQLVRISSMTVDSIDGTVFTDTNGNDKLDAGEAGVAGRTVFIDNDGTGVPDANNPSTVTDANGNYTFSGLAAGTYHVREVSPDNVTVSEPLQTVTVAADATSAGVDFAEQVIPPTPQESYITAVYQDILGRAPDAEGLAYWEQQLTAGTKRSVFTSFLSHSDEYYSNFVIKPDYLKYLGREADDAGVAYWLGKIHGGLTDQRLETDLLASDEYFEHAGGDNAHWIDGIYQSLLNRGADPNGVKYWLAQLSNGEARAQIALSIASGPEAEALTISDDYMRFLGREPDADGKSYWLKQFADGKHNEDVIAAFAASDEYYQERTS